jgi:hypothetical protein
MTRSLARRVEALEAGPPKPDPPARCLLALALLTLGRPERLGRLAPLVEDGRAEFNI